MKQQDLTNPSFEDMLHKSVPDIYNHGGHDPDFSVKFYSFEDMLNNRGFLVYTNVGFSMLPLLRQRRDIIEIRKKGPERCKKYDVALYKRGDKYILHRVLKVLPDGYLIAGDHNTFVERDVTDKMILGVMTRVIRNGKDIYMDNPWYRLYVHLWCDCWPARMLLLRVIRKARGILGAVKRRLFPRKGTENNGA